MRRLAVAVLLVATSCSAFGAASDALSLSPAVPTGGPPGALGPTPTPAPDGKPAIVVRTPLAGDELVSPVEVSGRAFIGGGEVTITLIDDTGAPLASTRTDVKCGSGCRGTFAGRLAFFAQQRISGAVVVFEVDPDDGSAVNVVSIPVTLVPGT